MCEGASKQSLDPKNHTVRPGSEIPGSAIEHSDEAFASCIVIYKD